MSAVVLNISFPAVSYFVSHTSQRSVNYMLFLFRLEFSTVHNFVTDQALSGASKILLITDGGSSEMKTVANLFRECHSSLPLGDSSACSEP